MFSISPMSALFFLFTYALSSSLPQCVLACMCVRVRAQSDAVETQADARKTREGVYASEPDLMYSV